MTLPQFAVKRCMSTALSRGTLRVELEVKACIWPAINAWKRCEPRASFLSPIIIRRKKHWRADNVPRKWEARSFRGLIGGAGGKNNKMIFGGEQIFIFVQISFIVSYPAVTWPP